MSSREEIYYDTSNRTRVKIKLFPLQEQKNVCPSVNAHWSTLLRSYAGWLCHLKTGRYIINREKLAATHAVTGGVHLIYIEETS